MSDLVSPFECPVCFEQYDEQHYLPTTLPCGHSCCLQHINALEKCFSCRRPTPVQEQCYPNFALRDGALMYFRLLAGFQQLQPAALLATQPACAATAPMHPITTVVADVSPPPIIHRNTAPADSSLPSSGAGLFGIVGSFLPGRYFESDGELARRLQEEEEYGAQPMVAREEIRPSSYLHEEVDNRIFEMIRARSLYRMRGVPLRNRPEIVQGRSQSQTPPHTLPRSLRNRSGQAAHSVPLKSCGHTCTPSSLDRCCACMDRRPREEGNTYPVYVDGAGWRNIGSRSQGYCPLCK